MLIHLWRGYLLSRKYILMHFVDFTHLRIGLIYGFSGPSFATKISHTISTFAALKFHADVFVLEYATRSIPHSSVGSGCDQFVLNLKLLQIGAMKLHVCVICSYWCWCRVMRTDTLSLMGSLIAIWTMTSCSPVILLLLL